MHNEYPPAHLPPFVPTRKDRRLARRLIRNVDYTNRPMRVTVGGAGLRRDEKANSIVVRLIGVLETDPYNQQATWALLQLFRHLGGLPRSFFTYAALRTKKPTLWVQMAYTAHRQQAADVEAITVLAGTGPLHGHLWDAWDNRRQHKSTATHAEHLHAAVDLAGVCERIDGDQQRTRVVEALLSGGVSASQLGHLDEIADAVLAAGSRPPTTVATGAKTIAVQAIDGTVTTWIRT